MTKSHNGLKSSWLFQQAEKGLSILVIDGWKLYLSKHYFLFSHWKDRKKKKLKYGKKKESDGFFYKLPSNFFFLKFAISFKEPSRSGKKNYVSFSSCFVHLKMQHIFSYTIVCKSVQGIDNSEFWTENLVVCIWTLLQSMERYSVKLCGFFPALKAE